MLQPQTHWSYYSINPFFDDDMQIFPLCSKAFFLSQLTQYPTPIDPDLDKLLISLLKQIK